MSFNIIKCLKQCRLFRDFDENEVNAIFDCLKGRIAIYSRGAVVASEGDNIEEIGIVLDGAAIAYTETEGGKKVVEAELYPGETFGDVDGYLPNSKLPYSVVVAENDTHIMYITLSTIVCQCSNNCAHHQKLLTNTLKTLAEKVNGLKNDSGYLAIKSMRLKIAKLVYEAWRNQQTNVVHLGRNRNEMAEYLNVSRPSMSREMMRMRDEGIIDFWKDKITILSLEKLKAIVEKE